MALQDDINNFNSTNNAGDFLCLSAQISCTTSNRIIKVSSLLDLPSSLEVSTGTVFFVEDIGIPIISTGSKWITFDNRDVLGTFRTYSVIYSWGCNSSGRLGINSSVACCTFPEFVNFFTDWNQVDVGLNHTVALRSNGTIWTWGANTHGQLGDGTVVDRSSPVSVVGGFTDWCQVAAGFQMSAGIRNNGTMWTWGLNGYGGLGNLGSLSRSSPVSVVGGFTDWCQVNISNVFSGAGNHVLALRSNGTAWAWGCNSFGQLGDNTIVSKSSPVSVVGGFTDWCQVSAGFAQSSGIRTDGTAWTWGGGTCGQLGDNTIVSKSSPVSVVGGFTDWCQISAGRTFIVAIRSNGTAWGWGRNDCGQLGNGTVVSRSSPVSVVGGFTDWCHISAGEYQSGGIRTNSSLWAWGCGSPGVLRSSSTAPCQITTGPLYWASADFNYINASGIACI